MITRRELVLRGAMGGEVRTAQFDGREYVVTPVVMLMGDRAIWAVNSDAPEFVPAEVISQTPQGWAGRPVVMNHPTREGIPVSANVPDILEGWAFGQVFSPEYGDDRLRGEAWLDPSRAERIGERAVRTLERVRNKEQVEISVGCFITLEDVEGTDVQGREYKRRWASIVPDHLALLEEGATGACSVEMGCGTPRLMAAAAPHRHLITMAGLDVDWEGSMAGTTVVAAAAAPTMRSLKERFLALVRPMHSGKTEPELLALAGPDGTSAGEIQYGLYMALYAVEPAFGGVDDWFPDTGKVIYCCYLPDQGRKVYRRSFTVGTDGDVTLADDREEVEEVTTYEPVTAAAAAPPAPAAQPAVAAGGGCGCGGNGAAEVSPGAGPATHTGETTMTDQEKAARAARVQALIENTATSFTADDAEYLAGLPDERLAAHEAHARTTQPAAAAAPAAPAAPAAAPAAPAAAAANPTLAEQLAALPEAELMRLMPTEARAMVERVRVAEAAERTELIARLAEAQDAYTEAELKALSLDGLRKLAKVAAVETEAVDFSALGGRTAAGEDVYANPPNGYRLALERQRPARQ